jgi:iduronate 2-sulfatase
MFTRKLRLASASFRAIQLLLGMFLALNGSGTLAANSATDRLNVLFIAVDDLRPELGCYGAPLVQSPNIDRLAAGGLTFNRAYCQQALCSPSRTSLLTGRRPDTTKVYNLEKHFRTELPEVITLPQLFKQHGYHSQGLGKIYHGANLDDAPSWSVPSWKSNKPIYGPAGQKIYEARVAERKSQGLTARWRQDGIKGPAWEAADVPDNALPDGDIADKAIEVLRERRNETFFLAVGFLRPHLPFVAPKKYFELYDPKKFELARNPYVPSNSPAFVPYHWGELRGYLGMPAEGPLTDEQARQMIHGYHASVSYIDAQVGRLLTELEQLKLRDRTIVILWGDHGWQLGEHGHWCKHTNYEEATRAPLIFSVPGQKTAGRNTDALVEFVDIFPSLAELCGLPLPEGLEGSSFKPLLENPTRPWKTAAFSQYPRPVPGVGRAMGHSLRTDRYRLTEWTIPGKDFKVSELYDYHKDPQGNVNVAEQADYAAKLQELSAQLQRGWKNARPPGAN